MPVSCQRRTANDEISWHPDLIYFLYPVSLYHKHSSWGGWLPNSKGRPTWRGSCWTNLPRGLPTKGCYLPPINIRMFIGWFQCIRIWRWGGRKIKAPQPTRWCQICCFQTGALQAFQAMPWLWCSCYKEEAIHPGNSAICDPNLQEWSQKFLE